MTVCCHTEINQQWSDEELQQKLSLLTPALRGEALLKKQWADRQLTIASKLLLLDVLKHFGLEDKISLSHLEYNKYHRPFFNTGIDFNIAHSGNIVICCATDTGDIGIDIEQVKPIDLADYADYFTPNEWGHINAHDDKFAGFFNFWTRKEAVLKALGTGFHTPLSTIDVSGDVVVYDATPYHLQALDIHPEYKCHTATTANVNPPIFKYLYIK